MSKRILCAVLLLLIVVSGVVSSCGSTDDKPVLTNVFKATLAESYDTDSSVSIEYMRCYNGKVFTAYQNGGNVIVRSISDDGVSEESTYKVPWFSENSEVYLQNFDLRDGKPVFLLSVPDENVLRLNYYVLECGGDNEEGILLPEFNQTAELFAAGSEYIILASTDNISVFSYDGVLVSECDTDGELTAMTEITLRTGTETNTISVPLTRGAELYPIPPKLSSMASETYILTKTAIITPTQRIHCILLKATNIRRSSAGKIPLLIIRLYLSFLLSTATTRHIIGVTLSSTKIR